ncbi:RNA polymerase subunit sigma-70 [Georgenia alba]|uniref:RNA polymerase subunit sigma-70 n=1 Tax=Georgenia alba TaxID=2233858 RepID=A0ABW2QGS0_9MICO
MSPAATDPATFEAELTRQRARLRLHCYRMVGSLDDADDLTQEASLRAWRHLGSFAGESSLVTWLFQIATNVCLDHLRRRARERRPRVPAAEFPQVPAQVAVPWLQPYADHPGDVDAVATATPEPGPGPEEQAVSRDTLRLAFVAAVQYLPPRQRAAMLLRDGLGWPVRRCAEALESSSASVNSALQRARATMRDVLDVDPDRWQDDDSDAGPLVAEYIAAVESADDTRIARLLHEEIRVSHAPGAGGNTTDDVAWYAGVATVLEGWAPILHDERSRQAMAMRPVAMNGDVGIAVWIREPGSTGEWEAFALDALTVRDGLVREISTFGAELFEAFGLPLRTMTV